jgi:hypothetical protein
VLYFDFSFCGLFFVMMWAVFFGCLSYRGARYLWECISFMFLIVFVVCLFDDDLGMMGIWGY